MTADPTTPEGRAELRRLLDAAVPPEWGEAVTDAHRYATGELESSAVNALPALLDALDEREKELHAARMMHAIADRHRADAEAALDRVRELVVWSDPARLGGTPCVRGTRTPVDQITALLDDFSDEEIIGFYPTPEVWQVAILRALDAAS